jgi:hypothetical protein
MARTLRRGTVRRAPVRRILPRIPGLTREPASTRLDHAIKRAVERECSRYGVSKSFVIRNALAFTFGIELGELDDYRAGRPSHDRQRNRR